MNMNGDMKQRIVRQKTSHLYILAAVLFLGILGTCGLMLDQAPQASDSLSSSSTVQNQSPASVKPIGSEAAREIAQANKPGATVAAVKEVPVNGTVASYTVQFSDGTKVNIAADNGEIKPEGPAIEPNTQPTDTTSTATDAPTSDQPTDTPSDETTDQTPQPEAPAETQ